MKQYLIIAGAVFVIAWLLFSQLQKGPATATEPVPISNDATRMATLEQRVESLTRTLDQELLLRQQLERRLQRLEQADGEKTDDLPGTPNQPLEIAGEESDNPERDQVDDADIGQRMINAGLTPQTVQQIRDVIDDARLQQLQIRDQAIREGWRDSPEFTEKMHELGDPAEQVRERFGDTAYDRYLYALERPNRVRVREVMRGSAAEQAGVRSGDIIESYANSPIYTMSALRQATTEGVAGESVLLELRRDEQPITTVIPRGPLGITMEFIRAAPQ